jgi:DNA-directed RNA polymerase subunit M/transcription elongation factor TFIIS
MSKKTKRQKRLCRLSKECPECGGILEKFEYQDDKNGVLYSSVFIECLTCDYSEDVSNKRNKNNKIEL